MKQTKQAIKIIKEKALMCRCDSNGGRLIVYIYKFFMYSYICIIMFTCILIVISVTDILGYVIVFVTDINCSSKRLSKGLRVAK